LSPTPPASEAPGVRPEVAAPPRAAGGTLDLLMDMEMPVLVRLGGTTMLIRDLLELGTGSVVEFRHAPDNPVDILVNGRVVARGTVVTVQGNYGVRILDIISQAADIPAVSGPIAREVKSH
jgi:flagellar motor switch protein FliN/FliY